MMNLVKNTLGTVLATGLFFASMFSTTTVSADDYDVATVQVNISEDATVKPKCEWSLVNDGKVLRGKCNTK